MINVFSWKWWVIMALALGTLACNREARRERADERYAARLERAEQRRLEREAGRDQGEPRLTARERAEQRRAARAERQEQRRAQREQPAEREPRAQPEPPAQSLAASPPAAAVEPLARVVFMRVSKQTSGVEATLFDVSTPEPKLIGTVSAASKLTHSFRAGTYTFMVVGETAEFMEATLAEGKTYYALIIPKSGAKRFALEPVRRDELVGKEFQGWDRGTRPMPAGAKGQPPADASEKRVRHWQEWLKKPESQKATLTLNAEDGR